MAATENNENPNMTYLLIHKRYKYNFSVLIMVFNGGEYNKMTKITMKQRYFLKNSTHHLHELSLTAVGNEENSNMKYHMN